MCNAVKQYKENCNPSLLVDQLIAACPAQNPLGETAVITKGSCKLQNILPGAATSGELY